MIKYFCDRCGADMSREKRLGFVSVNTRDKAEGELQEDNEFENWHFCKKCTEEIRKFVRTLPIKEGAEHKEKRAENEEKCVDSEKCEQKTLESEPKSQESESDAQEDEETGTASGKKKYDVGKIMALKKAGWKVKDIADEMKMTPQQVSNQIYLYNKKMQENGAEAQVHMNRIAPGKRPKL